LQVALGAVGTVAPPPTAMDVGIVVLDKLDCDDDLYGV
jgi:hypothetical protein